MKYYRFAISIFLFPALTSLFCLSAKDAHASDNLSDNEPLKQLFYTAEKINEPDLRFGVLIEISMAFREIKESTMAESVFSQALDIAHNTKESILKNIFISTLIDNYIKLGRADKALEIVKYIDSPDSHDEALLKIIMSYVQQGQYEKVINLSKSIDDKFSKAILFNKLINQFTAQEAYSEIMKVRDMIKSSPPAEQKLFTMTFLDDDSRKKETLVFNLFTLQRKSQIIKTMVNMSKSCISAKNSEQAKYILEQAVTLAKNIKSDYFKDDSLAQIGLTFIEIGELTRAQEILDSIRIAVYRSDLLAAIAIAYAEADAFEKAIRLTEDMGVVYQKNNVLVQIIIRQIKMGKKKEANQIIDSVSGAPSSVYVYSAIADYYIKNREYDNTVKICERINDRFIKLKVLVNMAREMQKAKDIQPAEQRAFKEILDSLN